MSFFSTLAHVHRYHHLVVVLKSLNLNSKI
jgi:hypothetical protein